MIVKLLTEHHLEFLSLKGGCTGSYESILVKMPHWWESHGKAYIIARPWCPPIREDNARALACALSPVHVDSHDIPFSFSYNILQCRLHDSGSGLRLHNDPYIKL